MAQRIWKRKRQYQRAVFQYDHDMWWMSEPPRIRFIAHYKWKKAEPKMEDYV